VTQVGGRRPATSWPLTLLAAVAIVTFVALGRWQWHRGVERDAQWEAFAVAGEALPAGARDLAALPRFERVTLTGRYDPGHQFLLENRSRNGRPGYEVLTPFVLADGRAVLVNRGWLPFSGYRDRLPQIGFDAPPSVRITGRLDNLPAAGLDTGRAGPQPGSLWPKLASFPTLKELAGALGRKLEPRIVLLDDGAPYGYAREWRPPGIEPSRHYSYAVQWWSFAALTALLWSILTFRRKSV
jgi:surfeit locus 1 family protein